MRVLFLILRNIHLPHLLPIYRWMERSGRNGGELVFSSPAYIASSEGEPGFGLEPEAEQSLRSSGAGWIPYEQIVGFRPDAVVVADADYPMGIDKIGARLVNVNHGLISKGCFYSDSTVTERENTADLICVPGPHHKEALRRTVVKPVVVTGLVKFDRIWNGEITRDGVLNSLGIDPHRRVILFAPTFNTELSAVPVVTDRVREWVGEGTHLLIKLHGMSPPEWKELYSLIADSDRRITLVPDMDITDCLVAADVMVSDVSSAFMEFIALDKPVVLVNNPLRVGYIGLDPRDIEYSWRDAGAEVNDPNRIGAAIRWALDHPRERSERRRLYGPRLVGPADGRASQRAGEAIMRLCMSGKAPEFLSA